MSKLFVNAVNMHEIVRVSGAGQYVEDMVWEQFVPTVGSNTLADSALLVIDTGEVVQYLNTVVRELATDVSKDVMGADEKIALSESMTLVLKSIVELEKFDHVYFPPMRDV